MGSVVAIVAVVAVAGLFGVALKRARARRRAEFEAPQVTEPAQDKAFELRQPDQTRPSTQAVPEEKPQPKTLLEKIEEAPEPKARQRDEALERGLDKTKSSLLGKLGGIFGAGRAIDNAVLDELEEALLTADVGVGFTMKLVDDLREQLKQNKLENAEAVRAALKSKMRESLLAASDAVDPLSLREGAKPRVILFVGVNGVGKTTTIGKIAAKLKSQGHSVVMGAGDTFRAAAAQQLSIWAERTDSDIVTGAQGADPASVIYNAIEKAKSSGADAVLADTAGRLHTKSELMDEINKVKRAAGKCREGAPDEVWLVVDATTGQNALQQAKEFHSVLELTGIILTKLDGTAKGGVVLAISDAINVPVRFVGVGEKAEDLKPFEPEQFVDTLFAA